MITELFFLISAIVLQLILVTSIPSPWAVAMVLPALVLSRVTGLSMRDAIRLGRAIVIITVPVLIVRLVAVYNLTTVILWADYAAGLLSAGWVAGGYLAYRKSSGVQVALTALGRLVPFRWGQTAADMVRSALFLLPEVFRRMRDSRDAARLRFARTEDISSVRRILAMVRATFVSLSNVPQRRAEAMIVRGIIAPTGENP